MRKFALLLLLIAIPAFAAKHAPLPDALVRAKTIYIINNSGSEKVMDGAYDAFAKWGKLGVAKSKESADMIVVFTKEERLYQGTTSRRIEMSVHATNSDDPLFQTTQRNATKCVDDLRKRMEE
jgi:hypothetical protein